MFWALSLVGCRVGAPIGTRHWPIQALIAFVELRFGAIRRSGAWAAPVGGVESFAAVLPLQTIAFCRRRRLDWALLDSLTSQFLEDRGDIA